mgnify:CR=1 FL=1
MKDQNEVRRVTDELLRQAETAQVEHYKEQLDEEEKQPSISCPYCNEVMVRTHYQNEEGDWFVCWLCGCKPWSNEPSLDLNGQQEE